MTSLDLSISSSCAALDKPLDFSQERVVYEHHRLLRTQDIDNFDTIVYIDEPQEFSREKCLHRKRGGINLDFFDYEKLKRIGEEAFNVANGKTYVIHTGYLKVKIKPEGGFIILPDYRLL